MNDFLSIMIDGLGFGEKKDCVNEEEENDDDSDTVLSQFSIESLE